MRQKHKQGISVSFRFCNKRLLHNYLEVSLRLNKSCFISSKGSGCSKKWSLINSEKHFHVYYMRKKNLNLSSTEPSIRGCYSSSKKCLYSPVTFLLQEFISSSRYLCRQDKQHCE